MQKRNRVLYFSLIIFTIIVGLSTRKFSAELPTFVAEYSGDTLWAIMVLLILAFIFKNCTTMRIVLMTLLFSYSIEISQLYQADWINTLRNTTPVGLILGYGFLWSDFICYIIGIGIGAFLDLIFSNSVKH